ncbi:alpha/beta hydrolase [Flavobacterium sp.]|uniref:alpha/beta hydrolase n=1 Tax=Flavobacterium sp. TaxID=239 RepID=UPI002B4AB791|nr:alpha/beta hydrolase [Flavobacterium sp.]HLF53393.1 alpha/beta hydrolase [Flavobacterium sp.]
MKKIILLFVLMFSIYNGVAQELYSKTFGNANDAPILFLHGGPGYNCAGFETSTAQELANNGFFVIVYDRRGEGRSTDVNARFTFQETFDDIIGIYKKYNLKKANLIGHSFGGIVATLFTEKYPEKVSMLELVSTPISLPETFKTILQSSRKIYIAKNDVTNLNYIDMIEKMDPTSVEYYAYSFGHAMQNGFYSPKKMSEEAKAIYSNFAKDASFKYASQMSREAPQGFLKNENYTSIDLTKTLQKLVSNKTKIYGLYGKDDGLYSREQIAQLQKIIGNDNLNYFDDCSHNVFMDQQSLFINSIKNWVK